MIPTTSATAMAKANKPEAFKAWQQRNSDWLNSPAPEWFKTMWIDWSLDRSTYSYHEKRALTRGKMLLTIPFVPLVKVPQAVIALIVGIVGGIPYVLFSAARWVITGGKFWRWHD